MKKILQKEEKILRKVAKEVVIGDIKTAKIKKILREMSEALKSQGDGVAIAAPQIGYPLRFFVVSGKVLGTKFSGRGVSQVGEPRSSAAPEGADSDPAQKDFVPKDLIFINPKISKLSRESLEIFGFMKIKSLGTKSFCAGSLSAPSGAALLLGSPTCETPRPENFVPKTFPDTTKIRSGYPICGAAIATPSPWLLSASDISLNIFFILAVFMSPMTTSLATLRSIFSSFCKIFFIILLLHFL